MKHTAGLFFDEKLKAAYSLKAKDMQEKGLVGQDFDGEIEGKKVHLFLDDNVWVQHEQVTLAEKFLQLNLFTTPEDVIILKKKLYAIAKTHSLIDGKEGKLADDTDLGFDFIEQFILCYLSEMLFPLYHRACTKAEDLLTKSLMPYIKEPLE